MNAPDGPVLGVLEGFYGRPWSWRARHELVAFAAPLGFDMYVYAPKDDPLHRVQWRDRHLPEELRQFERLAAACRAASIEFVFGVHPIGLRDEAADLAQLMGKAQALQATGVSSFCLLFDDLPEGAGQTPGERSASGRRHARIANEMAEHLAAGRFERLIVAPTEYHGLRRPSPYLHALGSQLDPSVDVFWTGPQVCSTRITVEQVELLANSVGRIPLVWDNYPVNDQDMRFDPHIRPLRGREPALRSLVRGVVANLGLQPRASRIALHTLAAWWRDPDAYDPEAAWEEALLAVGGTPAEAAALRTLGELAVRSAIEPQPNRVAVLDRFVAAIAGDPSAGQTARAVAELRASTAAWRAAAQQLLGRDGDPQLRVELAPWSRKLLAWADAVDASLAALAAGSPAVERAARSDAIRRLAAARRNPYRVADEQIDAFIRLVLWRAAAEDRPGEA